MTTDNNIPHGYKQTELGRRPQEWKSTAIRNIGYTYSGLSGKKKADFGDGNAKYIPFLNILTNTQIDTNNLERVYVSNSEHQNAVAKGDLFFNTSSETPEEVGMCAVLSKDCPNTYLNSFCFGFRPFENNIVDGVYLSYFFRSNDGRKLMYILAQGATRYNLSKTNLLELSIYLPPLAEQRAIAEALSDVDGLIAALDKKIAKKRLIKQGAMQQLLTGKTRLPGFTNDWVEIQVKGLGKWSKGQPFSKDKISVDGKNLCIHYGELFSYGEVIGNIKSNTDVKPSVKSSGKDVLFPASDVTPIGLGRCSALNVKNILLGGDIIILEVAKDNPAYISYVINLNKQQIIDRVTGTTVKHINSTLLGEIKISFSTNIKEQQAIATILSDMDKEITDLEARRDKYRLIKSGMMQKLLTGQIRLK